MRKTRQYYIFLIIISIIIFSSSAFAELTVKLKGTCEISNVIMGLAGQSNAHDEIAPGIYPWVLCDGINVRPATCTTSNTIIKLSSISNAHAENNTGVNYNNAVCSASVQQCVSCTTDCPSGYTEVLSLSSMTNAHIATPGVYPLKIVCLLAAPATPSAVWKDNTANSAVIPANAEVQAGATVKLSLSYASLGTSNVRFDIYKNKLIDELNVTLNAVAPYTNNEALVAWAVPSNLVNENLYFKATVSGGGEATSPDIKIVQGVDSTPTAVISSPKDRQIYFIKPSKINFSHSSQDDRSLLEVEWTFDDSVEIMNGNNVVETVTIKKLTGNSIMNSINARYTTPGQKNIVLKVTDSGGNTDTDRAVILVVGSPHVLDYIANPPNEGSVRNRPQNNTILIDSGISIPGSYIVQSSGSVLNPTTFTLTCIAGFCPQQSEGELIAGQKVNVIGYNTALNLKQGFLRFTWSDSIGLSLTGRGNQSGISAFERHYDPGTNYWIELVLDYFEGTSQTPSTTGKIRNTFTVTPANLACNPQGTQWIYPNGTIQSSTDPGVDCRRTIPGQENPIVCCPGGYQCNVNPNNEVCILTSSIDPCPSLTKPDCNIQIGSNQPIPTDKKDCLLKSEVWCKWDYQTNNKCVQIVKTYYEDPSGGTACAEFTPLSCEYRTRLAGNDCNTNPDGVFHFEYDVVDPALIDQCKKNASQALPCKEASLVPFFSLFNVFSVVTILIIFYAFVVIKRKK